MATQEKNEMEAGNKLQIIHMNTCNSAPIIKKQSCSRRGEFRIELCQDWWQWNSFPVAPNHAWSLPHSGREGFKIPATLLRQHLIPSKLAVFKDASGHSRMHCEQNTYKSLNQKIQISPFWTLLSPVYPLTM